MQDTDVAKFHALIEGVYTFYGRQCSPFALDVWWNGLRAYDFKAISDALGRHSLNPDTGQFLPKPADVVKMIEGTTLDAAMVAWAKVEKAIGQVGTYATVVFDDPLIHRVVSDMGGWVGLGQKSTDEWPFVGKEFQTRYRGFRGARVAVEYPRKLIGILDQQNGQHGFAEQTPVLIGDPKQAQLVHDRGAERFQLGVQPMTAALPAVSRETKLALDRLHQQPNARRLFKKSEEKTT